MDMRPLSGRVGAVSGELTEERTCEGVRRVNGVVIRASARDPGDR